MRKQLLRLLRIAPLALLFAGVAFAQTTGTIIGVVNDASTNKPVAGALVIATSPALQGEQTAVTDNAGNFRISQLPPGSYKLSVQLEGFNPAERSDITLRLDKTIRANLAVVPSSVQMEEQVVRTGTAPVVNVGSAETGTVVTKEFMASVPVGRDYQATALVAPTAKVDTYGISFAGATSNENGYLLDGMNVSDPGYGVLGSNLLGNFVEQVDVKTGSFMPEYGRATAGIINVVTKSGSNEFHGSIFGNLSSGLLSAEPKTVQTFGQAIYRDSRKNESYQADFGAEVGGPILRDRLWFFIGFAPVIRQDAETRVVRARAEDPANPGTALFQNGDYVWSDVSRRNVYATSTEYQLASKATFLATPDHTFTLAYYTAPQDRSDQSANLIASQSAGLREWDRGSHDVVGRWVGKYLSRRLLSELQFGYHNQSIKDTPTTVNGIDQRGTSLTQFTSSAPFVDGFPLFAFENYAPCTPSASGFDPCPVQNYATGGYATINDQKFNRFGGRAALSGLFSAFGQHNLKAGVDIERSYYKNVRTLGGDVTWVYQLRGSDYIIQDFRRYGFPIDGGASFQPLPGLNTESVSQSNAYFVQDSWTLFNQLTLNAGLRWETQDLHSTTVENAPGFNITNSIGPRVQAVWDFTRQGRGKIAGGWGRFYESIPLDIGDRAFGNERQAFNRHIPAACGLTVRPDDPAAVAGAGGALGAFVPNAACVDAVVPSASGPNGRRAWGQTGSGLTPVAPGLDGQYVDQFGASFEYEVLPDLSVGITYEGRRLGKVIEDISPDDGTSYFIANPGYTGKFTFDGGEFDALNVTATDPNTGRAYQVTFPKATRKYDGITFEVRKNFAQAWLAQASYTYSTLRGNYPGLFKADTGQIDPNLTSEFDLPGLLANRDGALPGDTPHLFKVYAARVFELSSRFRVTGGAGFRGASGTPVNFLGAHPIYGSGEAFVLPRGSAGRTPFTTQLDLRGKVEYQLSNQYSLAFTADVFNIFNRQTAQILDEIWTEDDVLGMKTSTCTSQNAAGSPDPVAAALRDCPDLAFLKTADGRPATINPNFGRPVRGQTSVVLRNYPPPAYQLPLAVRFGLALSF